MAVTDLELMGVREPMRRVAALEIEPAWLLALLRVMGRHGQVHRLEGIPEDARIVSIDVDHARNVVILYLESETFLETAPGAYPPSMQALTMTTYTLSPERRTEFETWIGQ